MISLVYFIVNVVRIFIFFVKILFYFLSLDFFWGLEIRIIKNDSNVVKLSEEVFFSHF